MQFLNILNKEKNKEYLYCVDSETLFPCEI